MLQDSLFTMMESMQPQRARKQPAPTESPMAAASPSAQQFHLFHRLPREIRDRIWYFCLPRRVAPLSNPLWLPADYEDRNALQQCWPELASKNLEARAPPFIAAVCREAREVAFRWGGIESADVSLSEAWVQRGLDTVLYGWLMSDSDLLIQASDQSADFFETQRLHYPGSPFALLADLFCQFDLEGLLAPEISLDTREDDTMTYLLHNARKKLSWGEVEDFSGAMDADSVMQIIYIHATKADILASGLFGAIADEPSQLVDCDDAVAIAKFRTLFDHNPKNKQRLNLTRRFDLIQSSAFLREIDGWLAMLRWRLLMRKWLFDKEHNPDSAIFNNPLQVFDASTIDGPFNDSISTGTDEHRLNRFDASHPWVVQEMAALPKIRPKIWFAYCTRNCEIKSEEELAALLGPNPSSSWHCCQMLS